jgi:alkanesulfonate monooxygenase SsuD/methylene tetrahydromethanopterin reductase-like flavin-dependent oxidoreductase (luciferase family)
MSHKMRFGLMAIDRTTGASPPSFGTPGSEAGWRDEPRLAEQLGFEVLWSADHLFNFLQPEAPWMDGWSLMPAWAATTRKIRLGVLITNLSWRSPVQVARAAMAVDRLSEGRLELGIGAGAYGDQAMAGMLDMPPGERIERLREGSVVLDRLLRGDVSPFSGKYTSYTTASMAPGCVQTPRPPLTIGAHRPRAIRVAAELCDTWNTTSPGGGMPFETLYTGIASRVRVFEQACAAIGRDPEAARRSCCVSQIDVWDSPSTAQRVVETLRPLGFSEFVFYWPRPEQRATFEHVATKVLPALRDGG